MYKKEPWFQGSFLAFLFFDFVATEVLLSFGEDDVLAENRVVFFQTEFVGGVHRVFLGVVLTNTGLFRDEADEFALSIILFSHNYDLFYHILREL